MKTISDSPKFAPSRSCASEGELNSHIRSVRRVAVWRMRLKIKLIVYSRSENTTAKEQDSCLQLHRLCLVR